MRRRLRIHRRKILRHIGSGRATGCSSPRAWPRSTRTTCAIWIGGSPRGWATRRTDASRMPKRLAWLTVGAQGSQSAEGVASPAAAGPVLVKGSRESRPPMTRWTVVRAWMVFAGRRTNRTRSLACPLVVGTGRTGSGPAAWRRREATAHGLGEAVAAAAMILVVACRAPGLRASRAVPGARLGAIVELEPAWILAARCVHLRHVALVVLEGVSAVCSPESLLVGSCSVSFRASHGHCSSAASAQKCHSPPEASLPEHAPSPS